MSSPENTVLSLLPTEADRTLWLYGNRHEAARIAGCERYQPWHDGAADAARYTDLHQVTGEYDTVILSMPQQREEAEGLLAFAFERAKRFVLAMAPNRAGGTRLKAMMEQHGLTPQTHSKHHWRFAMTREPRTASRDTITAKLGGLAPRELMLDGENWWTLPGLFSWDRIDPGSRLLLAHLPGDVRGRVADLGCGYGYLSRSVARLPQVTALDAFDADARAVALCQRNGGPNVTAHWQDVRTLSANALYDAVIVNPPFHQGGVEEKTLGQRFLTRGWDMLKPGGRLFAVANRHLPYERVLPGLAPRYEGEGYKILEARKP